MPQIWRTTLKQGLIAGAVVIYVALTGMPLSLSQRTVVGTFSLGHLTFLSIFATMGYLRARALVKAGVSRAAVFLHAAAVGLIAAAMLAAFILFGRTVDLSFMFISTKPQLYDLLLFHQKQVTLGLIYMLVTGVGLSVVFAVFPLLPAWLARTALEALGLTLLFGVFSELVQRTVLKYVLGSFFALRGLKPWGAVVLFVAFFGLAWAWNAWRQHNVRILPANTLPATYRRVVKLSLLLGFLLILPTALFQKDTYLLSVFNLVGLYIIMGLGLNIVVGFAGLLDLGYVAFFAIGAYTMALLTSRGPLGRGWDFWAALPVAIVLALFAGILLGIPVLRMRGDYLAIVTLGFGEIIRILANSDWLKPWMGGALGVLEIPKPNLFGMELREEYQLYYLILVGIVLTWMVADRLYNSRVGRAWQAMREDEDVAEATGIHLVTTKLLAFGFGAAFSGLSGAIFAAKVGSVYPHSFSLLISINVLCLIIVGGMGSLPGVVAGAFALVGLPELLREFSEYRMLFYGIALIAMMLLRPEGFIPAKPKVYSPPVNLDERGG